MLVLSRKPDEQIVIGHSGQWTHNGPIVLTVVDVRDGKARVGVDASLDVSIHRREIYDAIEREKEDDAA